MAFKLLSKIFGAKQKGFAYDTPFAGVSLYEVLGTPALGTNTAVHAAVTLTASAQSVTTAITDPDYARALLVKGNASGIAGNVVIYGKNINGQNIQETIALNGSSAVSGNVAFASVYKIVLPAKTNASGDTVSIGTTNKLGLMHPISASGSIKLLKVAGTAESAAAVDVANTTITATTALDGAKLIEVVYLTYLI